MRRVPAPTCCVGFHNEQTARDESLENGLYRASRNTAFFCYSCYGRIGVSTLVIRTVGELEQYKLFITCKRPFPDKTADMYAHVRQPFAKAQNSAKPVIIAP